MEKHMITEQKSNKANWNTIPTLAICAWTPFALRDATAFCAAAGLSKSTKPYPVKTQSPGLALASSSVSLMQWEFVVTLALMTQVEPQTSIYGP